MQIPSAQGWVLYDGDCAFCVRWLHFWSPVLRRRGFEVDVLQADWTAEALGMARDETLRDIRLLTTGGATYAGADVYLYVARRIWWAWPFGVLFSLPGFNRLIWVGYRRFAANRHCVSGYCTRRTRPAIRWYMGVGRHGQDGHGTGRERRPATAVINRRSTL